MELIPEYNMELIPDLPSPFNTTAQCREAVIQRLAPKLASGKGSVRTLFDRLVQTPTEGIAWQVRVRGGSLEQRLSNGSST